jgi:hypothetical protein
MLSTWFPKVILAVSEEVVHEEELQEEPMAVKDENWFQLVLITGFFDFTFRCRERTSYVS